MQPKGWGTAQAKPVSDDYLDGAFRGGLPEGPPLEEVPLEGPTGGNLL